MAFWRAAGIEVPGCGDPVLLRPPGDRTRRACRELASAIYLVCSGRRAHEAFLVAGLAARLADACSGNKDISGKSKGWTVTPDRRLTQNRLGRGALQARSRDNVSTTIEFEVE